METSATNSPISEREKEFYNFETPVTDGPFKEDLVLKNEPDGYYYEHFNKDLETVIADQQLSIRDIPEEIRHKIIKLNKIIVDGYSLTDAFHAAVDRIKHDRSTERENMDIIGNIITILKCTFRLYDYRPRKFILYDYKSTSEREQINIECYSKMIAICALMKQISEHIKTLIREPGLYDGYIGCCDVHSYLGAEEEKAMAFLKQPSESKVSVAETSKSDGFQGMQIPKQIILKLEDKEESSEEVEDNDKEETHSAECKLKTDLDAMDTDSDYNTVLNCLRDLKVDNEDDRTKVISSIKTLITKLKGENAVIASELDYKELELQNKKLELDKKESALINKASTLILKESDLDTEKSELEKRKSELDIEKSELDRKELALTKNSSELKNKKSALENKEIQLEKKELELKNKASELENKVSQLEKKESELENKKSELGNKELEINNRASTLIEKESELRNKASEREKNAPKTENSMHAFMDQLSIHKGKIFIGTIASIAVIIAIVFVLRTNSKGVVLPEAAV
ncbi:hypothetical protein ENBRE01_1675 [Enteropsectra breve]|nr:hypothetical protein ENBRE01_1675 [Enteropsectra breve]